MTTVFRRSAKRFVNLDNPLRRVQSSEKMKRNQNRTYKDACNSANNRNYKKEEETRNKSDPSPKAKEKRSRNSRTTLEYEKRGGQKTKFILREISRYVQ